MTKIFETNKAKFYLCDNYIYKSFNDIQRNDIQGELLYKIMAGFEPIHYRNYILRPISVYGVNRKKGIKLEYLKNGDTLSKFLNKDVVSAIGLWLTNFYDISKKIPSFPNLHGDFHLNNGFFDTKNKTLVFFDPEPRHSYDYIEHDIYVMAHSIFITSLKRLKYPNLYLKVFFQNIKFKYSKKLILDYMNQNLNAIPKSINRKYTGTAKIGLLLFFPIYKIVWRKSLKKNLR